MKEAAFRGSTQGQVGRVSSRPRGQPRPGQSLEPPLSGSPHSTAFCELLIHSGRTFLTNTGKANAFVQKYAAVNRLSFDKTERTQARHLKKALQLPTAAESCCSLFTIRELDIAINAMRQHTRTTSLLPSSRHSAQWPRLNDYPSSMRASPKVSCPESGRKPQFSR